RLCQTSCDDRRPAAGCDRRPGVQVRRALDDAGRTDACLRDAGPYSAGRLRSGWLMSEVIKITPESKPMLPRGVRLQENPQQGWVLVAPERVFKADGIASVILKRCDGSVTISQMADEIAAAYNAPRDRILSDIISLLQTLADKRLLDVAP